MQENTDLRMGEILFHSSVRIYGLYYVKLQTALLTELFLEIDNSQLFGCLISHLIAAQ